MNRWIAIGAFGVLAALWLAFGAAVVFNPRLLDALLSAFRELPGVLQALVGLLALPVVAGLWVWEGAFPAWVRVMLVVLLALATLYTFYPRAVIPARRQP